MNFLESFRVAWAALVSHKLRSLLTMLGIIIGVGAVVGMLAIGNGYAAFIQSEFKKLGVGVFYLNPSIESRDASEQQQQPRLTAEDADAIMRPGAAPAVEMVAVEYSNNATVSAGGERYFFGIKGVTPDFFVISPNDLGVGRFYTADEEAGGSRVAVIGDKVATTLFGSLPAAIGQRININNVSFEVIGVTVTEPNRIVGGGRFNDPAEQLFVPYRTAVDRLFRNQVTQDVNVSTIHVKARNVTQIEEAIRQVTAVLRQEHRLTYQSNDFSVNNPEETARQAQAITTGFSAFLGTIGGISLLVGGIGIMNIMLVSVAQRTREIGLRKAVGARRRDIMWQFLIEAVVLCLVGGAIGVGLGYGLAQLGNLLFTVVFQLDDARSAVTLDSILLATGISIIIGVFFGLFPALRASRLDPIKALRNE
ncbi:MAG: ABC transporter permease [Chloroflexaceae bacterium]|nr:ABC transporter permease [Chloroflexaceae bacterium]